MVRRDLTKTEKITVGHGGIKLSVYSYMLILFIQKPLCTSGIPTLKLEFYVLVCDFLLNLL